MKKIDPSQDAAVQLSESIRQKVSPKETLK